jgi:hypothetical protein
MRRALLLFVIAGALALSANLTAFPQTGEQQQGAAQYELGAGEAQYTQEEAATTEDGCSWRWGHRFNSEGGWEWWCWDPQTGRWYATNEDGSKTYIEVNKADTCRAAVCRSPVEEPPTEGEESATEGEEPAAEGEEPSG